MAQLAAVFLISWRNNGGAAPDDPALARYFPPATLRRAAPTPRSTPRRRSSGTCPAPATIRSATRSSSAIEDAASEIHIVNPYISNRAILERLEAAALRGVRVRLIAPGKPTPPYPAAAFRHWYGRLLDAGVEILLHPEMAHAKVLRIDDARAHRRLQPRRPVPVPQRRAGPPVRRSGGRRADRAERSSTSWRRCRRRRRDRAARAAAPGTRRWIGSRASSSRRGRRPSFRRTGWPTAAPPEGG